MLLTASSLKSSPRSAAQGLCCDAHDALTRSASFRQETPRRLSCSSLRVRMDCEQGIWKALLPERAARYSRFVQDYESIRAAEGRGSTNDEYYLALPYRDLSGRLSAQWAMRARTFRYIERKIMPRFTPLAHYRLRILDLGAGNGWMSYRFATQGHTPVAVDLLINDRDGLGAAQHYKRGLPSLFPRFQAELDNLPFADSQFDLVIFNASFHYSENYEKTLAEAIRCVRGGGTVLIADTPWYSDERSGARMLEERRALFIQRYGFPSDEFKSLEFLTDQRLGATGTTLPYPMAYASVLSTACAGTCGRWWRDCAARANRRGFGSTPPRWSK